jgi:hypothetical protein
MKMNTKPLFACAGLVVATLFPSDSPAQTLPPIFDSAPRQPWASRVVAEFAKNTFLENLVVDEAGIAYLTSHEEGVVYRVDLAGKRTQHARVEGKLAGIAKAVQNGWVLTGSLKGGMQTVFLFNQKAQATGTIPLPDAAFLNGVAALDARTYLVADSYAATIWKIDVKTRQVSRWLQHELLARADDKNPIPAANGIKVDALRKRVLVSNTAKQLLVEVPLVSTREAGIPKVLVERVNIDDFSIAKDGRIYAATHIYNSVIRIDPDLRVAVIAEAAQGMTGSTAVALNPARGGSPQLFVTTNGGMFLPPASGIEPGKLVRLSLQ